MHIAIRAGQIWPNHQRERAFVQGCHILPFWIGLNPVLQRTVGIDQALILPYRTPDGTDMTPGAHTPRKDTADDRSDDFILPYRV